MELPKNKKKLDEIFKDASMPDISEFNGEYSVDMLTGFLPSLKKFSHRKIFFQKNGKVFGWNILFNNAKWGHFFLEVGNNKKMELPIIIINYNCSQNSFITNKIRDYIRCVQKGKLYLGRFNYMVNSKIHFLGYFSLRRELKTK